MRERLKEGEEEGRGLGGRKVEVEVNEDCVGGLDVGTESSARRARSCEAGAGELC